MNGADHDEVTVYSFQESGSFSTCPDGFWAGYDEIIFNSLANFSGVSMDWGRNVKFEVSSGLIMKTFVVNLLEPCGLNINKVCNCDRRIGQLYFMSCKFKEVFVDETYIKASLTGLRGRFAYSKQQRFPRMFIFRRRETLRSQSKLLAYEKWNVFGALLLFVVFLGT
ncbi:hypothetical protein Btru_072103 [Bulinus truncatus]|nr:hypothetical protein Btru_072103 [Bulinus truncatus]